MVVDGGVGVKLKIKDLSLINTAVIQLNDVSMNTWSSFLPVPLLWLDRVLASLTVLKQLH